MHKENSNIFVTFLPVQRWRKSKSTTPISQQEPGIEYENTLCLQKIDSLGGDMGIICCKIIIAEFYWNWTYKTEHNKWHTKVRSWDARWPKSSDKGPDLRRHLSLLSLLNFHFAPCHSCSLTLPRGRELIFEVHQVWRWGKMHTESSLSSWMPDATFLATLLN